MSRRSTGAIPTSRYPREGFASPDVNRCRPQSTGAPFLLFPGTSKHSASASSTVNVNPSPLPWMCMTSPVPQYGAQKVSTNVWA
eukprot:825160-Karenia_brevis.AAC.1